MTSPSASHPWKRQNIRSNYAAQRRVGVMRATGCSAAEYERHVLAGEHWCDKHGWTVPPPSKKTCRQCKRDREKFTRSGAGRDLKRRQEARGLP